MVFSSRKGGSASLQTPILARVLCSVNPGVARYLPFRNIDPDYQVWFSFFYENFCCQCMPLKDSANLNPPASQTCFLACTPAGKTPTDSQCSGLQNSQESIMFGLFLNFQATFPLHEQQACHLEQCLTHTPPALKLQLFVLKEKKQSFKLVCVHTRVHTHVPLKPDDSQQLAGLKDPASQMMLRW